MDDLARQPEGSQPPARQLRLLANLAPGATVVFGLMTAWLAITTLQGLVQPLGSTVLTPLALNVMATVAAGLATYRLGVGVPRVLRAWDVALVERARVSRDH